uniref:Uncharacterized protein n=1 Tax=Glossina pallidipes TaxID=7398 RepID=A0A1A9ZBJ6_GLOPL
MMVKKRYQYRRILDLKVKSMEKVGKIRGDKQFCIKSKKGDNRRSNSNQFSKTRIVLSDELEEGVGPSKFYDGIALQILLTAVVLVAHDTDYESQLLVTHY